jgi:hypothetical protein
MNEDDILLSAYLEILDPGVCAKDFDAAMAVLKLKPDWFTANLTKHADRVFNDVSPDRLSLLAEVLNARDSSSELEEECLTAFLAARLVHKSTHGVLPLRRAHSIAEMLQRMGVFWRLSREDLLWLFTADEYATPALCPGLAAWCRKNPITPAVSELIRYLRTEEDDSPILDHLAASLVPSVEGMMDLACWENGFRSCGETDWQEAAKRWEVGKLGSPEDAAVLAPSLDPNYSASTRTLKEAIRVHGWEVISKLLREARDRTEYPVPRVILNAWLNHFGGDQ